VLSLSCGRPRREVKSEDIKPLVRSASGAALSLDI
jgi:hypothetical protein